MICGDLKLILKGPILIPGIPDISGDVLDEETIRKAALTISRNGILIDVDDSQQASNVIKRLYYDTNLYKKIVLNLKDSVFEETELIREQFNALL